MIIIARNSEQNEKQRETRKAQILTEALYLFAQKGLYETKIKDIAQAIGMAQGLIYHYYASKEEIYTELIREALDKMNEAAYSLQQMALPPHKKISLAISQLLNTMKQSQRFNQTCLLISQASNSAALPESTKKILQEKRHISYEVIADIMEQGQDEGYIIDADPDELSLLFWTTINGLAIYQATHPGEPKLPSDQLLIRIFIKE